MEEVIDGSKVIKMEKVYDPIEKPIEDSLMRFKSLSDFLKDDLDDKPPVRSIKPDLPSLKNLKPLKA